MNSKERDRLVARIVKSGDAENLFNTIKGITGVFEIEAPVTVERVLQAGAVVLAVQNKVRSATAWETKMRAHVVAAAISEVVVQPEITTETVETPVITPTPKKSKRSYLPLTTKCLEEGTYTKKELVAAILAEFPTLNPVTIDTFVIDLRNSKYTAYKDRTVVKTAEGRLAFAAA